MQVFLAENGKAVFASLATTNPDKHVFGVNVVNSQIEDFANSQAGRIGSKQDGFVFNIRDLLDD